MLLLDDPLAPEPLPRWRRHVVGAATMGRAREGWRLAVEPTRDAAYRDSQLDEGDGRGWKPPLRLEVRARFSHGAGAWQGTAGFGWWNAPLTGDIGTVLSRGPQVLWFFLASPPNDLAFTAGWPGHGAFAQSLDFGRLPLWLLAPGALGLLVPALRRVARRVGARLGRAAERPLPALDVTAWHDYIIEWRPEGARFLVDGEEVLATAAPPRGPLSLIFWADNQWGSLALRGGRLKLDAPQWLELASIRVEVVG